MSLSTSTTSQCDHASVQNLSVETGSKESALRSMVLQSNPSAWRANEVHINSKNCCGHIESFVIPVEDGTVEIRRTTLTSAHRLVPPPPKVECCAETRRNGQVEISKLSEASYKTVESRYNSFLRQKIENLLADVAENPSQLRWEADMSGFKAILPGENVEVSVRSTRVPTVGFRAAESCRVVACSTHYSGVSVSFSGQLAAEVLKAARESLS
jgi:hypothetical protein